MKSIAIAAIALSIALKSAAGVAGEQEAMNLAKAIGMEQSWAEKVIGPAIDLYLERARSGGLNPPSDELIERSRARLQERLSWDRVGRGAVNAAFGACDDETLIGMQKITVGFQVPREKIIRTRSKFAECTKDGDRLIAEYLSKVMREAEADSQ